MGRLMPFLDCHPDLRTGPGDDCAVIEPPGATHNWVLTSDPLVEGVHFSSGSDKHSVGHKACGRVLSDLAAMGGEPEFLLVDLVAPEELEVRALEKIYSGISDLGREFGAAIIGGDLAGGSSLELHLFGVGRLPVGRAILRSGASAGELLCLSGSLGGSAGGRHLRFSPRVREGIFLRESGLVGAMMDISDGLASDLPRLLRSSAVGARIEIEALPVSDALRESSPRNSLLNHLLCDGEDYELLFSVKREGIEQLKLDWAANFDTALSVIGSLTPDAGELCLLDQSGHRIPFEGVGYEHFRSGN